MTLRARRVMVLAVPALGLSCSRGHGSCQHHSRRDPANATTVTTPGPIKPTTMPLGDGYESMPRLERTWLLQTR